MKVSNLLGVAGICMGLYGCGGGDNAGTNAAPAGPSSPAPPVSSTFSVNDVYVLAQSKSETDDPRLIDGGNGASVSGSDDTSDPKPIE
jgi:hypothetical protein